MADSSENLDIKKRARRRLVGASALALAAAVVLPMVMDHDPRPPVQDVQVRIPGQGPAAPGPMLRPVTPSPEAAPAEAGVPPLPPSGPELLPPVRKPEPAFYQRACELLEIQPFEAVFLDDLGINLKPAAAMGMQTIKVEDPDKALADLSRIIGMEFA